MTENTILKSVKFDRDELVGGGAISNRPPVPLLPTEENLSRYTAIFPDYSIDKGNVLRVDTVGRNLFTSEYPKYSDSQSLAVDPNRPIEEKFYSTDASSTTMTVKTAVTRMLVKTRTKVMCKFFMYDSTIALVSICCLSHSLQQLCAPHGLPI